MRATCQRPMFATIRHGAPSCMRERDVRGRRQHLAEGVVREHVDLPRERAHDQHGVRAVGADVEVAVLGEGEPVGDDPVEQRVVLDRPGAAVLADLDAADAPRAERHRDEQGAAVGRQGHAVRAGAEVVAPDLGPAARRDAVDAPVVHAVVAAVRDVQRAARVEHQVVAADDLLPLGPARVGAVLAGRREDVDRAGDGVARVDRAVPVDHDAEREAARRGRARPPPRSTGRCGRPGRARRRPRRSRRGRW